MDVVGFGKLLEGSLGIEEPWYVEKVQFSEDAMELHIYIGIHKGARIACPHCGAETKRFGYEKSERKWRHGDTMFAPTYVHCKRPKVLCPGCGAQQAAETLERHKSKILNFFHNRLTNAICEGINSMIQAAKRKARGFGSFEGYAAMIYLVSGKLQLACPNPF